MSLMGVDPSMDAPVVLLGGRIVARQIDIELPRESRLV
jgi:hypothetical protein